MTLTRSRHHSSGACLALILFLSGCEKLGDQVTETFKKAPTFPITRTLTDNTGRPLEATIIGRGVSSITVIRKGDGSRFEIPLDRLSPDDRELINTLPLTPAPPALDVATARPAAAEAMGSTGFLEAKRVDLEKRLENNMTLLLTIDRATVKGRSLKSERDRLLNELSEIIAEIHEKRSR